MCRESLNFQYPVFNWYTHFLSSFLSFMPSEGISSEDGGGQEGREPSLACTGTHHHTSARSISLHAPGWQKWSIHWQGLTAEGQPVKGWDCGAGCVKAPSVPFRGWNAEDNCPGKGSPTPAENACSELTFPMGLPAKIKLSSSGSLLAGFFPTVAHLSQLEAKCFKLLLNFVAKFLYFLFPPAPVSLIHTPLQWLTFHVYFAKVCRKKKTEKFFMFH